MPPDAVDPVIGRGKSVPLEVPFGKLDTKTDPAMLPPGALTQADNCSVQMNGIKAKRFGYLSLAAPPSTPVRAITRGSEMAYIDGPQLRAYNPTLNNWPTRGNMAVPEAAMARAQVAHDQNNNLISATMATANGVTVYAWINSQLNNVYAMAVDDASGTVIVAPTTMFAGSFTHVYAVAVGNFVMLVAESLTIPVIQFSKIDTSSTAMAFTGGANITANVSGGPASFYVAPYSSTMFLMTWCTAAGNIAASTVDTAGTLISSVTEAEPPAASACIVGTPGENIYWAWFVAGVGLRVSVRNATLAAVVAPFTLDAYFATNTSSIGMVRKDAASVWILYTQVQRGVSWRDDGLIRDRVRWRDVSSAGATAILGDALDMSLASAPFLVGGSLYAALLLASSSSTGQQTLFLTRLSLTGAASISSPAATIVGMAQYRSANNALRNSEIANVVVSGSTATMAIGSKTKGVTAALPLLGVDRISWKLGDPSRFAPIEALSAAAWSAAICAWYDGSQVTELQFLGFPEGMVGVAAAHGSPGLADATYIYIVIYEWIDELGNAHQSSRSVPLSVVVAGLGGNGQITLSQIANSIATLRRYNTVTQSKISVFRNAPSIDIDVFYKIKEFPDLPGTATSGFVDFADDATITGGQRLYTGGGVLDKEPPPPSSQMILHQNALWCISADDPYAAFYSGDIVAGVAPWFSSGFQVRSDVGGPMVALASLDDTLIIFKRDRILYVAGQRPNATGAGGTLSTPQVISSDVGCIDWRSIVTGPKGVYFLSAKGIYLIDRGRNVSYAGGPVEAYAAGLTACASAKMLPDRREIRWEVTYPTDATKGRKLVYNYEQDEWTTHSNAGLAPVADAIVGTFAYTYFTTAGAAWRESATAFYDGFSYVPMTLEFGWLMPAGLMGLARVQYVIVLADKQNDHALTLDVAMSFEVAYGMSKTWTAAQINALPQEMLSFNLPRQQGASFRARITDAASGVPTTGAGFHARGLRLMAIAKRGSFEKFMNAVAKQ